MQRTPTRGFFVLLNQLRGAAVLLVIYSHLVGNYLDAHAHSWLPARLVSQYVEQPLQIAQHFGFFGVALFFFISGFVVTNAATGETVPAFATKRFLRIYPPVVFTVVIVLALLAFGVRSSGVVGDPSIRDVLLNLSLTNYLFVGSVQLVGVGWTLIIEMLFYVVLALCKPLLGRFPLLVPVVILGLVGLSILFRGAPGGVLSQLASFAAFVPLLVMGQLVYLVKTNRSPWASAALAVVCWVEFVMAITRTSPLFADFATSYVANAMLAFLIFLLAVLLEGRARSFAVFTVLAQRSYSLYLVHVPVGFTLLTYLNAILGLSYTLSLLAALVATGLAAEVSYRFVEKPGIRLGRFISRTWFSAGYLSRNARTRSTPRPTLESE